MKRLCYSQPNKADAFHHKCLKTLQAWRWFLISVSDTLLLKYWVVINLLLDVVEKGRKPVIPSLSFHVKYLSSYIMFSMVFRLTLLIFNSILSLFVLLFPHLPVLPSSLPRSLLSQSLPIKLFSQALSLRIDKDLLNKLLSLLRKIQMTRCVGQCKRSVWLGEPVFLVKTGLAQLRVASISVDTHAILFSFCFIHCSSHSQC